MAQTHKPFQFTHPCGCDHTLRLSFPPGKRFQFTHPCGCDTGRESVTVSANSFNSRTRVGATLSLRARGLSVMFQFTHPCGCDRKYQMKRVNWNGFNSRTRVGATEVNSTESNGRVGFNSRTRVGATPYLFQLSARHDVSIHAPVWVRPSYSSRRFPPCPFQFTHPCGCDPPVSVAPPDSGVSIHAPVWVRLGHQQSVSG